MSFTISTVSAETGIAKEVLRKWESRYGFPAPERDLAGDRLYPADQVRRLKLIKKLLDDGMRPSQVVALAEDQLLKVLAQASAQAAPFDKHEHNTQLITWLKARDPLLLYDNIRAELVKSGLRDFLLNSMPAMTKQVGDAWASGEIAVRDEHLYTEIVTSLVREALSHAASANKSPRVLITTVPGELHTLGVLMVEATLTLQGARCISLGAQSPLSEIVLAASDYAAQVVALSFSESFPKRKIVPLLRELRTQLPAQIELWAGGAGTAGIEKIPRGASVFQSLNDAGERIKKLRAHA